MKGDIVKKERFWILFIFMVYGAPSAFAQHNPIPTGSLPFKIGFMIWLILHDFVFFKLGEPMSTIMSALFITSPIWILAAFFLWRRKPRKQPHNREE